MDEWMMRDGWMDMDGAMGLWLSGWMGSAFGEWMIDEWMNRLVDMTE